MFSWAFCGKRGRFHCSLGSRRLPNLFLRRYTRSQELGEAKAVSASEEITSRSEAVSDSFLLRSRLRRTRSRRDSTAQGE